MMDDSFWVSINAKMAPCGIKPQCVFEVTPKLLRMNTTIKTTQRSLAFHLQNEQNISITKN